MTAPARFHQADVTRAIKAAQAAGVEAATIRLRPDGEIVICIGSTAKGIAGDDENPWDDEDPE